MKLLRCFDILDRFIRRAIMIAMLLIAFFVLAFCGFRAWENNYGPSSDPACFSSNKVLVKMGEHVFAIPRKYATFYILENDIQNKSYSQLLCYRFGDKPIAFRSLEIHSPHISNYDFGNNINNNFDYFSPIVTITVHREDKWKNKLIDIKSKLANMNKKLEDLPSQGNFYIFSDQSFDNFKYYISNNNNFVTSEGNPIVIGCNKNNTDYDCSTQFYSSHGEVITLSRVNTYFVPLEEWPNFYKAINAFLEEFEIKK